MNVSLRPEVEGFVAEKVRSGQYTDANDLVNDALEMLMEQEELTPDYEAYLRREVRRGLEQLDRGEYGNCDTDRMIAEERARLLGRKGTD